MSHTRPRGVSSLPFLLQKLTLNTLPVVTIDEPRLNVGRCFLKSGSENRDTRVHSMGSLLWTKLFLHVCLLFSSPVGDTIIIQYCHSQFSDEETEGQREATQVKSREPEFWLQSPVVLTELVYHSHLGLLEILVNSS